MDGNPLMPITTAIVLVPLLGALAMLVPGAGRTQARITALLAAGLTLAMTISVLARFDRDQGTLQFVDQHGWVPQVGLQWLVGIDGISLWLIILTAALFLLAIIAAVWRPPDRELLFLQMLLVAETGMLGLFAAGDLVLFYVFWEAMLVPFYFLIGLWGGDGARRATVKFVVYTMAGSLLMLVAVVATAITAQEITGQFTFSMETLRGVDFSETQSTWLFLGFALAFAIKLPLWPFHAWLPDAYRAAPILVTGLLAAVVSKAGVYGLIRVGVPTFPEGADNLAIPISVLALIGIVWGSLVAWRAPTMRLLVGYSSLAHLGFIALGVMAFDVQAGQGAVLQMVNHGLVVAAAFAIVAIIDREALDDRLERVGGMARGAPRLAAVFLIVAMAALAIPGSNAFVGEFFILAGVFRHHVWLAVLATIGIVYAAIYMLRLYQEAMNGPPVGRAGRDAELRLPDYAVLLPILAAMLVIALWPAGIVGATRAAVERAVAPAQVAAGRDVDQIARTAQPNPPPEVLPLPGDEPAALEQPGAAAEDDAQPGDEGP
jgi:NADH-quinone oxidoreductase subunit M